MKKWNTSVHHAHPPTCGGLNYFIDFDQTQLGEPTVNFDFDIIRIILKAT
jgi:hypothetical protein